MEEYSPEKQSPPHRIEYGRAGFFVTFFLFRETFSLFMDYCFLSSDATTLLNAKA
jgi:hypothetical protein